MPKSKFTREIERLIATDEKVVEGKAGIVGIKLTRKKGKDLILAKGERQKIRTQVKLVLLKKVDEAMQEVSFKL